jgi:hypothetical protein
MKDAEFRLKCQREFERRRLQLYLKQAQRSESKSCKESRILLARSTTSLYATGIHVVRRSSGRSTSCVTQARLPFVVINACPPPHRCGGCANPPGNARPHVQASARPAQPSPPPRCAASPRSARARARAGVIICQESHYLPGKFEEAIPPAHEFLQH